MKRRCTNCKRLTEWFIDKNYENGKSEIIELDGCDYNEWIVVNPLKSKCEHFKKKK